MIPAELRNAAFALTEYDRAKLADELIASLDGPSDRDAQELWRQEISRRIEEIESGAIQPIDATLVVSHARDRVKRSH
ncbi:MAG: addiction module protein [Chromatocurvus sp.]